ncbi:MAG TPA: helix-turn-helix domain-containing protein [Pirellulales bacterium]|jgi:AcrR family transcriptional regulator|nr:helix-turn-helix domain-containing protein [Pirellulales bacterium]
MKSATASVARKLPAEERRAAIVKAVRQVFAEKGFDGTTTRELAVAAGVSEALLFKHFPNKEALYSAMQLACCNSNDDQIERLKALEPSASTLALLVHVFVSKVLAARAPDDERSIHCRLMLRSVLGAGEFARMFMQGLPTHLNRWMQACLEVAIADGDAHDGPIAPDLAAWFAHHLTMMISIYTLPAERVMDYGVPQPAIIEQVVWFALRGLGMKEEAIRRYYNPRALALLEG